MLGETLMTETKQKEETYGAPTGQVNPGLKTHKVAEFQAHYAESAEAYDRGRDIGQGYKSIEDNDGGTYQVLDDSIFSGFHPPQLFGSIDGT